MQFLRIITILFIASLQAKCTFEHPEIHSNTIHDVIYNGWKSSDKALNDYFRSTSQDFFIQIKKSLKSTLIKKTNEEYIREQILEMDNNDMDPEKYGLPARASEEEYLKMLKLTIKYDLNYSPYKNRMSIEDLQYVFAYVKWLEHKKDFKHSYEIYILLLENLQYLDKTIKHNFLNGIKKMVINSYLKNSVKESFIHNYYVPRQKKKIYTLLSSLLMHDESYWDTILKEEKRVSLAFTKISFLDELDFEKFIHKNSVDDSIFDDINRLTLKKYFEDKKIMNKVIIAYAKKYDAMLKKMQQVTTNEEYLGLEKRYKSQITKYFDMLKKRTDTQKPYQPSSDEFIDAAALGIFGYYQVWRAGRSKPDFLQTIEKNIKYLEDLKDK